MKMALQYRINRGERGRTRFLGFRGAYHGDTFAAMSVCDPEEGMHRLFGPMVREQLVASLPSDEKAPPPAHMRGRRPSSGLYS